MYLLYAFVNELSSVNLLYLLFLGGAGLFGKGGSGTVPTLSSSCIYSTLEELTQVNTLYLYFFMANCSLF